MLFIIKIKAINQVFQIEHFHYLVTYATASNPIYPFNTAG